MTEKASVYLPFNIENILKKTSHDFVIKNESEAKLSNCCASTIHGFSGKFMLKCSGSDLRRWGRETFTFS